MLRTRARPATSEPSQDRALSIVVVVPALLGPAWAAAKKCECKHWAQLSSRLLINQISPLRANPLKWPARESTSGGLGHIRRRQLVARAGRSPGRIASCESDIQSSPTRQQASILNYNSERSSCQILFASQREGHKCFRSGKGSAIRTCSDKIGLNRDERIDIIVAQC